MVPCFLLAACHRPMFLTVFTPQRFVCPWNETQKETPAKKWRLPPPGYCKVAIKRRFPAKAFKIGQTLIHLHLRLRSGTFEINEIIDQTNRSERFEGKFERRDMVANATRYEAKKVKG